MQIRNADNAKYSQSLEGTKKSHVLLLEIQTQQKKNPQIPTKLSNHTLTSWPDISTCVFSLLEKWQHILANVYSISINFCSKMETTQMTWFGWMDKHCIISI